MFLKCFFFKYPTNVENKIYAALESPVTGNQPIDNAGVPDEYDSKIYTTEHDYRLTPTELEYFNIRKMREEQRIKGNLDLEEYLKKTDDSFDIEELEIEEMSKNEKTEARSKTENNDADSLDSLLELEK